MARLGCTVLKLVLACSFAGCLVLCLSIGVLAQSGDESALRTIAERFFSSYASGDEAGFMHLWSEKSPELAASRKSFLAAFSQYKITVHNLTVDKITLGEELATVVVVAEVDLIDAATGARTNAPVKMGRTLHLIKQPEGWKIWRYVSSKEDLAALLASVDSNTQREKLLAVHQADTTADLGFAVLDQVRRIYIRGEYARAISLCEFALEIGGRVADRRLMAGALTGLGNLYGSQGSYIRALDYYKESLKISEDVGDRGIIAKTLNNEGNIQQFLGNYAQAQELYERSLIISNQIADKGTVGMGLNNIGIVHRLRGNYAQALDCYQKGLEISQQLGDKVAMATALNNIGNVHSQQGNLPQAIEYFQKCLRLAEELGDKYRTAGALCNIGDVYSAQGDLTRALSYHQESLRIEEDLDDRAGIALLLNSVGKDEASRSRYSEALDYYQRSLKISQAIGGKTRIAETLVALARAHYWHGNLVEALESANRAAALAEQIGLAGAFFEARTIAGKTYRALNQPDLAHSALIDAINTIEKLRDHVAGGEQDRQRFFESNTSPYYEMAQLQIESGNVLRALEYAERAKGRTLLDSLQSGRADITRAMSADEQEAERRLNGEIVSLNTQVHREKLSPHPDQSRLAELESALKRARLEYERFQTVLYAVHPELRVQRGQMQPIGLQEISSLIPDVRTALLEYVVMEGKTHLFVATRREAGGRGRPETTADLREYTINVERKELARRVEQYRTRVAGLNYSIQEQGRYLHQLLLGPALTVLHNKTNLIIVPDGILWELPFQALLPLPHRYLIETSAVSYAPSLTVLREMSKPRARRAVASGMLLALGNAASQQTKEKVTSVFMDERLLPLPEAERQVSLLAKMYGTTSSKFYIGEEAQEARLKAEGAQYRILHLAAHGILNDKNPMYSQLVLSLPEGGSEDGLLEAWEILKLELKADLAVLSACETARGRIGSGEGMIGLSWAFFVAGVPATVASQWRVESTSTTDLMLEFHRNLRLGRGKAEALRKAALKLIGTERTRHPFFWAGFVLVGNGR